ncbi:hypothetical protein H4R33_006810 [Dimargaris cristalligena]|uniref:Uncharacterized protein n=1 Tax=Dimargaris cristalligena TaxID=215637 RepID=A0A4V1J405_9FUNG|nr:hypothetical protein H4R33_006810 [Dimargaris cristalligena]RKP33879.1 hypothetical protein BJ085DRAFT_39446 [Dimargaris cristalligena]|eukprot:RKP33879.1 hypothetical protein BJ085DRAFT_39446 [Dimargaris cristalligena]
MYSHRVTLGLFFYAYMAKASPFSRDAQGPTDTMQYMGQNFSPKPQELNSHGDYQTYMEEIPDQYYRQKQQPQWTSAPTDTFYSPSSNPSAGPNQMATGYPTGMNKNLYDSTTGGGPPGAAEAFQPDDSDPEQFRRPIQNLNPTTPSFSGAPVANLAPPTIAGASAAASAAINAPGSSNDVSVEPMIIEAEAHLTETIKEKYDELPVKVKEQAVILTNAAGLSDTAAKTVVVQANDKTSKYHGVFDTLVKLKTSILGRWHGVSQAIQDALCDYNMKQFKNNELGYMLGDFLVTKEPLEISDMTTYATDPDKNEKPYSITYVLAIHSLAGSVQQFMESAKNANVDGQVIQMKVNEMSQQIKMTISPEASGSSSIGIPQSLKRRSPQLLQLIAKTVAGAAPKVAPILAKKAAEMGTKFAPAIVSKFAQIGAKIAPRLFAKPVAGLGAGLVAAGAAGAAVGGGATVAAASTAAVGAGTAATAVAAGAGATVAAEGLASTLFTTLATSALAVGATQGLNSILRTAKSKEDVETRVTLMTVTKLVCQKTNTVFSYNLPSLKGM